MSSAQAFASLAKFSADLRTLASQETAIAIAAAAAPVITDLAKQTFAAGEDAFGGAWAPKEDGTKATLRKTDTLFDGTRYVATGTKLRVSLVKPEYRYVVGKRPIFPRQGDRLPAAYSDALARTAVAVCKERLGR